ncbi:MAG TPA: hypothetical protein VHC22_21135 [Pirellulales bacterium]|nr:hypothetical protein [Pirellulales bacterium]
MKSFRLERRSVEEFVEGWPVFAISIVGGVLLGWLQATYPLARVFIPLSFGFAFGPRMVGQLRHKYPTAKQLWLLSVGFTTCLVGVAARMAFPAWQGGRFDLVWVITAFVFILAFVLVNRGNKEVV